MSSLTKIIGLTIVALALLALLPVIPIVTAQATEAGEIDDLTVVRAKAIALQYMLNNSLRLNLNLSEQLRTQIELLLSVNISELTPQELRVFVRNANMVLAEICERARNAVGKSLEEYARGLAMAIEARVRNIARHYGMGEDEVKEMIADIARSRNMREVFEALKIVNKILIERQCHEFANAIVEQLRNRTSEAIVKGDAQGLEVAYRALDKAQEALNKTLEILKATNASSTAIGAVEEAIERASYAKEVIRSLKESLLSPEPEAIREHFNKTIKEIATVAKAEADELLSEIERLLEIARKLNATELIEELIDLKKDLSSIVVKLESAISVRDAAQILDELAVLKAKVTVITKMLSSFKEEILNKFKAWISELEGRAKELSRAANDLSNRFKNLRGKMQEVIRGMVEKLLDTVTSDLSNTVTSKLMEARNKLEARDFEGLLNVLTDVENILAKIHTDINEIEGYLGA
ncbi:MAG: hypothetical protein QXO97_06240 [Candidatus Nezhaarchaeales archaeon]